MLTTFVPHRDSILDPEVRNPVTLSIEESDEEDEQEAEIAMLNIGDLPPVNVPYEAIELIFNNTNIWANIQFPNPAVSIKDKKRKKKKEKLQTLQFSELIFEMYCSVFQKISFDIENLELWSPFISGWRLDDPIKPFYSVRSTVGPPLPEDRCKAMEEDIQKEMEGLQMLISRQSIAELY
jgi:hypothetical protein